MTIFRKILFIILTCLLFASCNDEELKKENDSFFIDLLKEQIKYNDEIIHYCFGQVIETSKDGIDMREYQKMLDLQRVRQKALQQFFENKFENIDTVLLREYENALVKKIKSLQEYSGYPKFGKTMLKSLELIKLERNRQGKSQKIAWAYRCLKIEREILVLCREQLGVRCGFGIISATFSNADSLEVGDLCEIVILPLSRVGEDLNFQGDYYTVYYEFNFWIDEIETKIEYDIQYIGDDSGILSFTIPKKGHYKIRGGCFAKFDNAKNSMYLEIIGHDFELE